MKERQDRLEEACYLVRQLFRSSDPVTFQGVFYVLDDAPFSPGSFDKPIPIMVGGTGPKRTLRTLAMYGDIFNLDGWAGGPMTKDYMDHKWGVLEKHCEEVNRDITEITKRYNVTTDILVVITEAAESSGINPCRSNYVMEAQNNLHWYLENIPGVSKVISLSSVARRALSGYAEGNLKWTYLPHNEPALAFATSVVDPSTGLINEACSIMPIYVFTEDHKATTISTLIKNIETYNQKFLHFLQRI